jgi:hypothetical protein
MNDTTPQTAAGKVLFHFAMSLDGFVAGPDNEAVRIGLAAADGKNLEVFSPTIGGQLLGLGLIDEIDLHILPVLLGDGIRLYDHPGGEPVRLHLVGEAEPRSAVNVRYRPVTSLSRFHGEDFGGGGMGHRDLDGGAAVGGDQVVGDVGAVQGNGVDRGT